MLGKKKGRFKRRDGAAAGDRHAGTLAGKPQPRGNTKINKNGLN